MKVPAAFLGESARSSVGTVIVQFCIWTVTALEPSAPGFESCAGRELWGPDLNLEDTS